jgi:hypothetical protein
MERFMRIPASLLSICGMIALAAPLEAAEECKLGSCANSSAVRTADGWDVNLRIRARDGRDGYEFFNLRIHGHPQQEVDAPGNNVDFKLAVPADWDGSYQVQACRRAGGLYETSYCHAWSTFTADRSDAQPALGTPDPQFCDWYAAEAVARAEQGARCGLTGPRWHANAPVHVAWCMGLKSQQEAWGEHNARLSGLADCTRKEVDAAPPVQLQSGGAPVVTVKQDVDVYQQPGGVGQPIGILKAGSRPQMYETRPDQWCRLAGNQVPGGGGWVWCGQGFELQ